MHDFDFDGDDDFDNGDDFDFGGVREDDQLLEEFRYLDYLTHPGECEESPNPTCCLRAFLFAEERPLAGVVTWRLNYVCSTRQRFLYAPVLRLMIAACVLPLQYSAMPPVQVAIETSRGAPFLLPYVAR